MTVEKLELINYRNYGDERVLFSPSVNVIYGNNAAGKTNLIESLYYLSALKPIHPGRDEDLIKKGEQEAKIYAEIRLGGKSVNLCAVLSRAERKKLYKNDIRQKSGSAFTGILKSVLFCPDDLMLIKESGAQRRRLLDNALCQLRPSYFSALAEYNRLLEQKNKILKSFEEKPSLLGLLPSYNAKMAEIGGRIIYMRNAYARMLREVSAAICREVSGGSDCLSISYCSLSNIKNTALPENELSRLAAEHQRAHNEAELASKSCLSGPHKDDLAICINESPAKTYASQGQIRSAVLSIKLAERDIFYKDTGEYPVLLLDDVLSELDGGRQSYVLNRINGGQVFITCCADEFNAPLTANGRFHVENGRVSPV